MFVIIIIIIIRENTSPFRASTASGEVGGGKVIGKGERGAFPAAQGRRNPDVITSTTHDSAGKASQASKHRLRLPTTVPPKGGGTGAGLVIGEFGSGCLFLKKAFSHCSPGGVGDPDP